MDQNPGQFPSPPVTTQRPAVVFASWWDRVLASLIDAGIATLIYAVPVAIGLFLMADASEIAGILLMVVGYLVAMIFGFWNLYRQGQTGQSIGKRAMGLRLVWEKDGQPIGGWMSIARTFVHYLDSLSYVGYLWPLWDEKRRTFADILLKTLVLKDEDGRPSAT